MAVREKTLMRPIYIAAIYLVASVLWIFFSDSVAAMLSSDKEVLVVLEMVKGWLFVMASALFLYWALSRASAVGEPRGYRGAIGRGNWSELADEFKDVACAGCDAFWIKDLKKNKIDYVSPGFEDLWKISNKKLYDDPSAYLGAVYQQDLDSALAAASGLEKDQDQAHQFRIAWPDGSARWVKLFSVLRLDSNGDPSKLAVIAEDVTDNLERMDQLRRQRDLAQKYLNVAGAIMVAIGRDEKVAMVNPKGCEILGYPEKEILGRNWFDYFIPEDERENVRDVFHLIVQGQMEAAESYENRVIIKGGITRIIEWRNTILKGDDGGFEASLSYGEDVTDKHQAQQGHLRLMRAVEQAAEGIATINTHGVTDYVNPSFVEITGAAGQDMVGCSIFDYIGQDGPGQAANLQLSSLAKAARGAYQTKFQRTDSDGREKSLEMTISPVRQDGQRLSGFVVVLRDVTDLRRLENKLRQSQKMEAIGTLAGGIAHDFNNILGSIIGYTELAAWDMPPDSGPKRYMEQVLMAGERAKELVGQILSFSRQGEKERRPIKLTPIIKETVKLLRASLPAIIDIESSLDKESGSVLSDPVQIQQVLMNLATNAAQAIGEQTGHISISLTEQLVDRQGGALHPELKPGMYTLLVVSDTGCGIPKQNIDKIFDPYFSTKKPGEGTGLGLAMVHGIVNSHGGVVSVYSKPGDGTTFKIFLPRITTEAAEPSAYDYTNYHGSERVLLVDDEQALIKANGEMLGKMGYRVSICAKPVEALDLFKADPMAFDLVITDYAMPVMSGTDLARSMLEIRPDLPLILCTGFSETISRQVAGTMGFGDFIMKPVLAGQLAKSIRKVMDTRRPEK